MICKIKEYENDLIIRTDKSTYFICFYGKTNTIPVIALNKIADNLCDFIKSGNYKDNSNVLYERIKESLQKIGEGQIQIEEELGFLIVSDKTDTIYSFGLDLIEDKNAYTISIDGKRLVKISLTSPRLFGAFFKKYHYSVFACLFLFFIVLSLYFLMAGKKEVKITNEDDNKIKEFVLPASTDLDAADSTAVDTVTAEPEVKKQSVSDYESVSPVSETEKSDKAKPLNYTVGKEEPSMKEQYKKLKAKGNMYYNEYLGNEDWYSKSEAIEAYREALKIDSSDAFIRERLKFLCNENCK